MKNRVLWITSLIITILISFTFIQCNTKNSPDKTTQQLNKAVATKDSINDTSSAKHTIIIDNVDDPRQLQEILQIIENYSAENKIKDLNIQTKVK